MTNDNYLLFFDIDGTLLTEGKNRHIPQSALDALAQAQANGHKLFINTGRTYAELGKRLRTLPVDGFVCGCGTYITLGRDILLHETISQTMCRQIIDDLSACRLEGLLESDSHIYYDSYPYTSRMNVIRQEQKKQNPRVIESFEDPSITFDKFCLCTTPHSDYETFYEKYHKDFDFIDRGGCFYEVVPSRFSKATGMAFLEEYFSIPNARSMAFGDSTNDLTMLSYAGISIAMEQHDQALDAVVDDITGPVEGTGIYDAMKKYKII